MLPPSNTLPCTYQLFCAIMKDIGKQYHTNYTCPNDHIIYYGQHETNFECLECGISIYDTN